MTKFRPVVLVTSIVYTIGNRKLHTQKKARRAITLINQSTITPMVK